jgi:SAM-dependent methyltransferase
MSFISTGRERWTYFDLQLDHPDWQGKRVLDFGGNWGAMLQTGKIDQNLYWCIDVSRDAIEQGSRLYPEAHWIFFDRYNAEFNPEGIPDAPLNLGNVHFDFILAYSVFTHLGKTDIRELARTLREHLTPGGRLAFTFIDPHYRLPESYCHACYEHHPDLTNIELYFLKERQQRGEAMEAPLPAIGTGAWYTVVDNKEIHIEEECSFDYKVREPRCFDTFHTVEYMQREFPDAVIRRPPEEYHPGGTEMQHCCILSPLSNDDRENARIKNNSMEYLVSKTM